MVESGKRLLSSRFVQVPDTPTNFHHPITSRSNEIAKTLAIPNSPKESESVPIMPIMYRDLLLILPIKYHPDLSTLSVFQDFYFPSNPLCTRIWSGFKIRALKHKILQNINFLRSDHLFVSYKCLIFSNFSELPPPPNRADPVRLCQSRILDLCLFFTPSFILTSPL